MNRYLYAGALAAVLAVMPACSTNDQNDNGIRFTLTVINNNATPYDLFMSSNLDNQGFVNYGSVNASGSTEFGNLLPNAIYSARLSVVGGNPNTFVYQHQVISGGSNVTWQVP